MADEAFTITAPMGCPNAVWTTSSSTATLTEVCPPGVYVVEELLALTIVS